MYKIPRLPLPFELEDREVLKLTLLARSSLAELKGLVQTIPNESILLNTLTLQEAKDSSEVENIVTTHDDLYKSELRVSDYIGSAATKEVLRYRQAIRVGFEAVRKNRLLTNSVIKKVQGELVGAECGFRVMPGTALRDTSGGVVYRPPQESQEIERLMRDLERFINESELTDLDPLVKMAIIHHQFESIHPFYDGNGRTGRIISILYLIANQLLDLPILYLSRYITHNKRSYYELIQDIRDCEEVDCAKAWKAWIVFILRGVDETARHTIAMVKGISALMAETKRILRPGMGKVYRHELLNHLFFQPYTKIEFMQEAMGVQRKTASKYLDQIVELGLLRKVKVGRDNYYINQKLVDLLMNHQDLD